MLKGLLKKHKDKGKEKPGKSKPGKEPMGCGASAPETKTGQGSSAASRPAAQARAPAEPAVPDVGLEDTHTYVKFLGRGGTGDAHLYEDKADGEVVAIKLMKRPLPKIIMPNILREIKVGRPTQICPPTSGCVQGSCHMSSLDLVRGGRPMCRKPSSSPRPDCPLRYLNGVASDLA